MVNNQYRLAEAEQQLGLLEKDRTRLAPIMRVRIRSARANLGGRNEEVRAALIELIALSPRGVEQRATETRRAEKPRFPASDEKR